MSLSTGSYERNCGFSSKVATLYIENSRKFPSKIFIILVIINNKNARKVAYNYLRALGNQTEVKRFLFLLTTCLSIGLELSFLVQLRNPIDPEKEAFSR